MPSNSSSSAQFPSRRNYPRNYPLASMKRCTTRNLPLHEDLVRGILLRLSVKSLCRCKLVCKQWCALIQSPSFMKQHFCHESNQERLLIRVGIFEDDFFLKGYKYALSVDETFSKYEEPHHLQMPDSVSDLIGPLNGVFCIVSYDWPLGLLNPATRQFKPLPLFERPQLQKQKFEIGLGLDPLTGDFKLVMVSFHYSVAALFSDSWRFLENVKVSRSVRGSDCNTYLNGVYYWLLEYHRCRDVVVLSFDMRTEKFKEIHVMSCVEIEEEDNDDSKCRHGFLALRGDSLILIMKQLNGCIDVWTMLHESYWIRTSRVLPIENHIAMRPVYFWKNDELLLEAQVPGASTRLIFINEGDDEIFMQEPLHVDLFLSSYNVCRQELGSLHIERRDGRTQRHWFFGYKESLVSLKGNCKLWDTSSDYIKNFFGTKLKVGSTLAMRLEFDV